MRSGMYQKCIVWGAGNYGGRLIPMLDGEGYEITAFCDRNAELAGKKISGYEIIAVEKAREMCHADKEMTVIIGVFNTGAIEEVRKAIWKQFGQDTKVITGRSVQDAFEDRMLNLYHQKMVFKWEVDLEKCFLIWLDNMMSEVEYWVRDVAGQQGKNHEYNIRCRQNSKLTHGDIRRRARGGEVVMDIGSGLVSKYGNQLDSGGTVQLVPVDALAHFYNILNNRINDGFKKDYVCYFGLFEFLGNQFGRNYADYMIVDNALDHCIDPWRSLIECLYVLKEGGRMYLNHRRAEAVYEGWTGLHKWNIDCADGNMLIWNRENAVNVTERLMDFAEVKVRYDVSVHARECQNVGVEIVKKRDFDLGDFFDMQNENMVLTGFIGKLMEKLALDSRSFLYMLEQTEYVDK